MGANTKIEWCTHSFNPWLGCTKVSPACENCYAEGIAKRFFKNAKWGKHPRVRTSEANWKLPLRWNRQSQRKIEAWEKFKKHYPGLTDKDLEALGFQKPRRPRVFCGSMCDVFDDTFPCVLWRNDLMSLIHDTPNLDWLLLTKRISNVNRWLELSWICGESTKITGRWVKGYPPENVWLGITVCNQEEADRDIPKLMAVPAARRFLSIEPMLSNINLLKTGALGCDYFAYRDNSKIEMCSICEFEGIRECKNKVDWVIVGCESGRNRRAMDHDWARCVKKQCSNANVPFFMKQLEINGVVEKNIELFPSDLMIQEFPE